MREKNYRNAKSKNFNKKEDNKENKEVKIRREDSILYNLISPFLYFSIILSVKLITYLAAGPI